LEGLSRQRKKEREKTTNVEEEKGGGKGKGQPSSHRCHQEKKAPNRGKKKKKVTAFEVVWLCVGEREVGVRFGVKEKKNAVGPDKKKKSDAETEELMERGGRCRGMPKGG